MVRGAVQSKRQPCRGAAPGRRAAAPGPGSTAVGAARPRSPHEVRPPAALGARRAAAVLRGERATACRRLAVCGGGGQPGVRATGRLTPRQSELRAEPLRARGAAGAPGALPTPRMGIFGSKSIVWVPENEKLKEKCADAESWSAKERCARAQLLRRRL